MTMAPNTDHLAQIQGVILDVDGILTDGRIWLGEDGNWRRAFHMRDGLGIKALINAGLRVGWITGSKAPDIRARAEMLGVKFLAEGQENKVAAFERFLNEWRLEARAVACMGDDLPDLPLLKVAGLAVTVPEAPAEVRSAAAWITTSGGGHGAVRELCDLLLVSRLPSLGLKA